MSHKKHTGRRRKISSVFFGVFGVFRGRSPFPQDEVLQEVKLWKEDEKRLAEKQTRTSFVAATCRCRFRANAPSVI